MDAAVLIPVKDFRQAKARLAGVLPAADRIRLARWTADRVVAAAAPLPVFVACDDTDVAEWAEANGATVLWRPGMGLNAAVEDGIATLAAAGIEHVVVCHSDLPSPAPLANVVMFGGIVLVPDTRSDGTNVIAVPTHIGFQPSYGSQSFHRHLAHALTLGVPVRVQRDSRLALDIDTPDDLAHPLVAKVLPAWLPTNPANPR
ncbi:MAG TPA: 2-phospho-L-lactate guanylyltransferase [Ilumatobacteraceae bacterium]